MKQKKPLLESEDSGLEETEKPRFTLIKTEKKEKKELYNPRFVEVNKLPPAA